MSRPTRVPLAGDGSLSARPRLRRVAAAASGLLLATALGACTSDDGDGPDGDDAEPGPDEPTSVALETRVLVVEGAPKQVRQRGRLADEVGAVLQEYVDAAFLGEFPREDFDDAFARFTPGAARQARGDAEFLTGSSYADATTVRATDLKARLSALAPDTGPAGVTAFVRFEMDADGTTWTYRGRLLLTPQGDSYRIFGYDMKAVQG